MASTNLNQWKNTDSVIRWYKDIPNKANHSFINFDVVDFYSSILEDLLTQVLAFALQYDEITDKEKTIIIQANKSLLFNENTPWCKKTSNSLFDATMGSFDGAETFEIVGSYILSKLTSEYGHNIGLYRDDGLAAFRHHPRFKIRNLQTIYQTRKHPTIRQQPQQPSAIRAPKHTGSHKQKVV